MTTCATWTLRGLGATTWCWRWGYFIIWKPQRLWRSYGAFLVAAPEWLLSILISVRRQRSLSRGRETFILATIGRITTQIALMRNSSRHYGCPWETPAPLF